MYSFANFFADHIFLQKKRKEKCKKRKKSKEGEERWATLERKEGGKSLGLV
jgi:hypothetical protein